MNVDRRSIETRAPATDTLTTAAAEANRLHDCMLASARKTLEDARRIGELLATVKDSLGHGQWLPWVKANLQFKERTARNYISIHARWDDLKSATVADLTGAYRLLAAPDDEPEDEVTIIEPRLGPGAKSEPKKAGNAVTITLPKTEDTAETSTASSPVDQEDTGTPETKSGDGIPNKHDWYRRDLPPAKDHTGESINVCQLKHWWSKSSKAEKLQFLNLPETERHIGQAPPQTPEDGNDSQIIRDFKRLWKRATKRDKQKIKDFVNHWEESQLAPQN